jgi:hypothetical protein
MRRHSLRALALVGALTALSLPVFAATQTASACSTPNCQVIVPIGGVPVDTFFSPISATSNGATFAETQITGEQTAPIVVPGSLSVSINDQRGNNQGLDVELSSTGFSSSLSLVTIPATDLSITAVTSTLTFCGPLVNSGCSSIGTAPGAVGATLGGTVPVPVAVACPAEAIGMGMYDVGVDMNLTLQPGTPEAEAFEFAPISWFGNFTVTINEGPSVDFGALGCGGTVG